MMNSSLEVEASSGGVEDEGVISVSEWVAEEGRWVEWVFSSSSSEDEEPRAESQVVISIFHWL